MQHVHRWLFDPSLIPYANRYVQYLRGKHNTGTRWLVQRREGADHRADLKICGDHLHVRVWPVGQMYFEFNTSGVPVVNLSITSEGITFPDAYKIAVIGVTVSDTGKLGATIRSQKRTTPMEADSIVKRQTQINLIDEPVGYRSYDTSDPDTPKQKKWPSTIYDSWAPNHPYTGVFMRAYNFGGNGVGLSTNRGPLEAHASRDVAFDVPYQDTEGTKPVRIGLLRGASDWPRAMGRMKVEHEEHGTREFAVYIDAFNQVGVFPAEVVPTGPLLTLDQNIDEDLVKRQVIPLPSWVYKGTTRFSDWFTANNTTGLVEFPELDWQPHPDGDRACAVVHERQAANFDATYFETGVGANPLTSTEFEDHRDNNTGYITRHNATFQKTNLPQRYCIGTGIVEFVVNIELTGARLQDYTFSLTVNVVRRPTEALFCTMLAGYVWYDIKADDWTADNPSYVAFRGDMVALDIERYYRGSDGNTFNFFSVKNMSLAGGMEIRTWQGLQLLDFDLATLSFAILVPVVNSYNRMLVSSVNPSASVSLPYTVVHPSVAISTFNKPRRVLFPDSIPTEMKNAILEHWDEDMRAKLAAQEGDWTFMPLNDARTWATPELANLRNYYCQEIYGYKSGLSPTLPPVDLRNWFNLAMYVYLPATPLYYIDNPRFGWHAYADEIMNRMWINPQGTFFVHPNGSWAFYDNQIIYNQHGMYGPTGVYDALTPFQNDDSALEHCIFDHVHFETEKVAVESSFHELYNKAVLAGQKAETLQDTFDTVTKAQLRANFDKTNTITQGVYVYLDLKVSWYPHGTFYLPEQGYQKATVNTFSFLPGGGGLRDMTLGGMFNEGPNYTGQFQAGYGFNTPIHFSSCLMIA